MMFCTFNERPLQSNSATRMARPAPARIDPAYSTDCYREDYRARSQLSELRNLEKENARLKKIVAELELDKLILKESLNHLKPRA